MKKSKTLKNLKQNYPNIMADIGSALGENDIQFKKSQSEIVALSSKTTIKTVISSLIPEKDRKILLDIVGVRDKVYIRKKCG